MNIIVQIFSVPQAKIRSEQVGDWWYRHKPETGTIEFLIHVLETLSPSSQLAVANHELTEAWQCWQAGITDKEVSSFDDKYEAERKEGKHGEYDEPGDDPRSPYRNQHAGATFVERATCSAIGLDWREHEKLDGC